MRRVISSKAYELVLSYSSIKKISPEMEACALQIRPVVGIFSGLSAIRPLAGVSGSLYPSIIAVFSVERPISGGSVSGTNP
jgi:hypothetical protein